MIHDRRTVPTGRDCQEKTAAKVPRESKYEDEIDRAFWVGFLAKAAGDGGLRGGRVVCTRECVGRYAGGFGRGIGQV